MRRYGGRRGAVNGRQRRDVQCRTRGRDRVSGGCWRLDRINRRIKRTKTSWRLTETHRWLTVADMRQTETGRWLTEAGRRLTEAGHWLTKANRWLTKVSRLLWEATVRWLRYKFTGRTVSYKRRFRLFVEGKKKTLNVTKIIMVSRANNMHR